MVEPLHQAGDALLQAVNGVVLWIMAAETVPEAAKGITNQLQVVCLPKKPQVKLQADFFPSKATGLRKGKYLLTR